MLYLHLNFKPAGNPSFCRCLSSMTVVILPATILLLDSDRIGGPRRG